MSFRIEGPTLGLVWENSINASEEGLFDFKGRSGPRDLKHSKLTTEEIEALPRKFELEGKQYDCLDRHGDWALYKVIQSIDNAGTSMEGFEVVRIQRRITSHHSHDDEADPPNMEYYPSQKTWGTDLFRCPTLAEAQQKYLSLTRNEK